MANKGVLTILTGTALIILAISVFFLGIGNIFGFGDIKETKELKNEFITAIKNDSIERQKDEIQNVYYYKKILHPDIKTYNFYNKGDKTEKLLVEFTDGRKIGVEAKVEMKKDLKHSYLSAYNLNGKMINPIVYLGDEEYILTD